MQKRQEASEVEEYRDEKGSVTVEKQRVHRGERRELREGEKQSERERAALMSTAHTM